MGSVGGNCKALLQRSGSATMEIPPTPCGSAGTPSVLSLSLFACDKAVDHTFRAVCLSGVKVVLAQPRGKQRMDSSAPSARTKNEKHIRPGDQRCRRYSLTAAVSGRTFLVLYSSNNMLPEPDDDRR